MSIYYCSRLKHTTPIETFSVASLLWFKKRLWYLIMKSTKFTIAIGSSIMHEFHKLSIKVYRVSEGKEVA